MNKLIPFTVAVSILATTITTVKVRGDNLSAASQSYTTALQMQIDEPNSEPVTDDNFIFDTTADPNGKCRVTASGSTNKTSQNAALQWSLTAISGSTQTSAPTPAKGANVAIAYNRLPISNSQFGKKWLTLTHPKLKSSKRKYVKIFFDGHTAATNHPGAGSGSTPNWYFYWKQTGANYGSPTYNGSRPLGETVFSNGAWGAELGDANNGSYTPPIGDNTGNALDGIDHFAWVCRHEARHVTTLTAWWPNNWVASLDLDRDNIPDSQEAALGGTAAAPINGGPFLNTEVDTDKNGYNDNEDYVSNTQAAWVKGSADYQDWANPGHQYN